MTATLDDRVAELERANAELQRQLGECTAVLEEERRQQAATAEVLQVINSSPGDLAPVFQAILQKAHALCGAAFGGLMTYDGKRLHAVATHNVPPAFAKVVGRPFRPGPKNRLGDLIRGAPLVHVADLRDVAASAPDDNVVRTAVELGGIRTLLAVPLRKDGALFGIITAYRQEARPFTDKQIALLQNFAAQAVIAMENARLLTETREALEQQTATAEVLQVINSSPGDLAPVFDAMLEKALRLCNADFGNLWMFDGELIRSAAMRGAPSAFAEFATQPLKSEQAPGLARAMRDRLILHFPDLAQSEFYLQGAPLAVATVELGGVRSVAMVPIAKGETSLGLFGIYRKELRPFSEKEISLLQNFAAQAVIAMENARLLTETREALEQQTATADVLQVINSSPGDLTPVFDAMLEKALDLCEAKFGNITTYDGEAFHFAAAAGHPEFADWARRNGPGRAEPGTTMDRMLHGEHVIHIADMADDEPYRVGTPVRRALVEIGGFRTALAVALRKDDMLLGMFHILRQEVRRFSDKQIALLQNFAAQAVIAMENARLLTETREALEQQTATAEVLQVINSSPGDLTPVFDAMLDKAMRLCNAPLGLLLEFDGECFRTATLHGAPPAYVEFMSRGPIRPGPNTGLARLAATRRLVHIEDLAAGAAYREGDPLRKASVDLAGMRTFLAVPLTKKSALLGAFVIYRQEIRPFSDKQITLLENFAAQAVIAMENARLLTETREALDQQTATAEVLQVINASPGDLAPVFDAMLEKALALCEASFGGISTYDGERFHVVGRRGATREYLDFVRTFASPPPSPNSGLGRIARGERVVHIADIADDDAYRAGDPLRVATVDLLGARTCVWVALHKEGRLLGMLNAYRRKVRPFSDKQIALLQNFAAQAVIAIENARLLTETREALEQQTATAEVLQVINSSPGDLTPVFDAMLDRASILCGAAFGCLWTYDGERMHAAALRGAPPDFAEFLTRAPHPVGPDNAHGRLLRGEPLVHIADVADDEAYRAGDPVRRNLVELGGGRTLLAVPLWKDERFLGDFVMYRTEVRPFSDKQIALLQNFAAQAVIAMENARLLTETREALKQQTATAEVLQVINSSPGDLAPVFDAMLKKATLLCEAAHGNLWTYDGERFHPVAMHGDPRFTEWVRRCGPAPPAPGTMLERIVGGEDFVQIADAASDDAYRTSAYSREVIEMSGARTTLVVPLKKDNTLLGAIFAYRHEVRQFSDKQIALLQNFAAQAVIAMENARLITETREALEQQTATAEVLQVINSSPGELTPVFDAMLEKAMRLCEAAFGELWTYDGHWFEMMASRGMSAKFAEFLRGRQRMSPETAHGRVLAGEDVVHIHDIAATKLYRSGDPHRTKAVEVGGVRSLLAVSLRKDEKLLGMLNIYRLEVRPFSDKQIALLQNFAAQAVIAIENARLITELRQRTGDLQEALEYQTATSEVLKVISQSAFDLETVLQAVVATAVRLCRADSAAIYRNDNGEYRWAAGHMQLPDYEQIERNVRIRPGTGTLVGRVATERQTVQILDVWTDPLYEVKDDARIGGVHTMMGVPLLREGSPIGVIGLARRRVEAFSQPEIQLVTTFADQAVIAIENARLFNDLRQRTRDLQESLEYQTASSDVLRVISQSGGELEQVLDTLVETAARICRADSGFIFRLREGLCRMVGSFGIPAEYKVFQERNPIPPGRGTLAGRTMLERRAVHIEDAAADPEYTRVQAVQLGRQHTMLGVPLVREDTLIGVITLARSYVEPFTEKQIALVTTFADQAVIAIENARLFNELRARTAELGRSVEELKMLSEVGRAVSSTLDLRNVLSTVLNASLGVTWANAGAIFRYIRSERAFRLVDAVGWDEALTRSVRDLHVAEAETAMGEAAARRMPIQIADLAERPSAPLRDASLAAGFHSALIVPLVGPERILGAITLMRQVKGEFPPETARLMQTLASQSVLAIQNARLFREIAEKSEQLALASQHKSQFLANMSHELRTPLNAILGYAELLVDGIYGQLPDRPRGVLERIQNNGKHLLALINDVLDLAKIEAGQLALTLEDYNLPEMVRSVVTATEPLATSKGLKFIMALRDDMPMAHGDARRVSQVLLNLVGNAIKFTDEGEVEIQAAAVDGQFVVTVRDTGPGIADADQERIFGEFQQIDNSNTRKQGGTGLGLAISKRMVELQGGTISVDSVLGLGSTFRVVLPIHVDQVMEEAA